MSRAVWQVGQMVRETGIALERLGCRLQGNYTFLEQLSRHREVMALVSHKKPVVNQGCFVAPSALVVGKVEIGAGSSVWYGACVKADGSEVKIGTGTAVQEGAVVTADAGNGVGRLTPADKSRTVLIAAGAIIYSATLGDNVSVGLNAIVNKGAVVEEGGAVADGVNVPAGTTIPAGKIFAAGGA
ncbi:trimeric LpxA-like protein, partial [Baffinella frigidus]